MIEIKDLQKTFKVNGKDFNALSDVSLSINDGDIYGIIGMSGAGKSTLVRCINMLERPTKGARFNQRPRHGLAFRCRASKDQKKGDDDISVVQPFDAKDMP